MTDLAEPEDLLSRFGVAFIADPDVQSLVDSDGTWLVSWIGRHRAMTHLHELDLLELRQFLRVGGDLARGRGRGRVCCSTSRRRHSKSVWRAGRGRLGSWALRGVRAKDMRAVMHHDAWPSSYS
jgi:hypothetical protein